MTQASDITQQDLFQLNIKDTYTDRRALIFKSSAERHAQRQIFLSGKDALKLVQDSGKVEANKDNTAS